MHEKKRKKKPPKNFFEWKSNDKVYEAERNVGLINLVIGPITEQMLEK